MADKTKQRVLWICLLLVLGTAGCYWSTTGHGFVNIDDHEYIYLNDHVRSGLSWDNIVWAFTTHHASNWHPLTWISHMVDCQLFGLNAGAHHAVNLLFHIADTLLLFLLLRQMTGAVWRSAFVAAFFAWHPLHVESVAWASERKDVLSTFFWLLTLMAYVGYTRTLNRGRYYLTLLLFAMGLMSKPMVVTLPCVLMLLDFWPLKRMTAGEKLDWAAVKGLMIEKLPFFALTLVACWVTYLAQQNATSSLELLSVKTRLANAVVAYLSYLGKTFWPVHLAAMYPYAKHLSPWVVSAAAGLLVGVTIWAVGEARQRAYLLTGWFWFLGTLVPTIGLVQVGSQSMADRYMYIPSIGLFVAMVWLLADWAEAGPTRRNVFVGLGVAGLAGCLVVTSFQVKTWQNGETLFRHAIAVTKDNYIAYDSLGGALDEQGRPDEALPWFAKAVEIEPRYPESQYNLGTLLMRKGKLDEAVTHLRAAISANPEFAAAYVNLGSALMKQGKVAEAGQIFDTGLKLDPMSPEGFFNLGTWLLAEGRLPDAVQAFIDAVNLKPNYSDAQGNLGVTLMRLGQPLEGIAHLEEAVRSSPTNSQAHFNLGLAYLGQSKLDPAVAQFTEALRLKPGQALIHSKLGLALSRDHQPAEAIVQYREALRLQPDDPEALNGLAWVLATDPDAKVRSGTEAVALATKACDATENKRPDLIETLAAAYAEAGRFSEAASAAQKAFDLAVADQREEMAAKAQEMLKLFQTGQAYRVSQ